MERKSLSGLGRILAGLAVAGASIFGLGGCTALLPKGGWRIGPPIVYSGGKVPKEIKDEEKLNPDRKLLAHDNSRYSYISFYKSKKGLELSYYSRHDYPTWYARVRDTNNDGEIDSIYMQDTNGKEINEEAWFYLGRELMLRNEFYRLSKEYGGVSRPKN